MRTKKVLSPQPTKYFSPELKECPACHAKLVRKAKAWRKTILTLSQVLDIYSFAFVCPNEACPHPGLRYQSIAAASLSLKGSTFGMDVLRRIGSLRMRDHKTIPEIHASLAADGLAISERQVQYLLEDFLALVQTSLPRQIAKIRPEVEKNGGLILSLDGVQPEKGNDCLYVVREVLTHQVLAAELLETSKTSELVAFLTPLKDLGFPILGWISDKQASEVQALAEAFPGVPHQWCQFHFYRNAAQPLVDEDRHLKTALKKPIRGIRAIEEALMAIPEARQTEGWETIKGYTIALRTALLTNGIPPFEFPGITVFELLDSIAASIERCQAKKGRATTPSS